VVRTCSGYRLCFHAAVLSPELLTENIAALTKAQGSCPTLGALSTSMRVAVTCNGMQVEAHTASDGWQPLDTPLAAPKDAWLTRGTVPDADQVVVIGVGLGYALLEHGTAKRVIAIEPHPGIATLFLSCRDWRRWFADGRLRLLTGPDYAGAADVARFLDGLSDISIVAHPLRARWEPDAVARATSVATRVMQNAKSNGKARRRFAGPYLLQTLSNLGAIGREAGLQALDHQFAGRPAVVAGAGPSLDENVRDLVSLQDRAVIVAADTALGPLLAGGVSPHLVVAVDPSALNAQHLTTPARTEDVALVAEGSVHPSVFERFAGRTFTFRVADHEPWPWLRTAGVVRPELKTWGSVLTSGFNQARRMGCDPIIFIGSDLAYTGMRPYCRGTIYDAMWQEWIDKGCTWEALMEEYFGRQPALYCADIDGEKTRTGPHLVSFRDWLVEQMNGAPRGRFVNATGAGILHGGRIAQASLGDVLRDAPALRDVVRVIRECHAAYRNRSHDARAVEALRATTASGHTPVPIDRWIAFAAETLSAEQIRTALHSA
jgi:hypothetical protein